MDAPLRRSIETYVRMGDRIATRQDYVKDATLPRDLPPTILEQTLSIAHMWQTAAATARLQLTAEAMYSEDVEPESGSTERAPEAAAAAGAQARWALLRDCDAWKDQDFLRTLIADGALSRPPSNSSLPVAGGDGSSEHGSKA